MTPPDGGWRYLVALGSNVRHGRHGGPRRVLAAAVAALADHVTVAAVAPVIVTAPVGPSLRRYANGAVVVRTALAPDALLALLKAVERGFGRRRGRRWGARVLDLDIVLWSGGIWRGKGLAVPHRGFRGRDFVLLPATRIAADWRDPATGLTVAQLYGRLTRPRPLPKRGVPKAATPGKGP
ncbi:MAG: 2-amino-4-hydroxy-6-hydroxymethyldihydropteridine diphosphokinase [Sphingomonadales bacterium]|nr:2-amino-4-hydroxy-6-hydroxymethyldihydropteridine diphosphokinase [Sphingomonadales bacterium]